MYFVRFREAGGPPQVGVLHDGQVSPLPGIATLASLLARPVLEARQLAAAVVFGVAPGPEPGVASGPAPGVASGPAPGVASGPAPGVALGPGRAVAAGPGPGVASGPAPGPASGARPLAGLTLLAPIDGRTEVWAAGVTYERSRQARVRESQDSADVYDRVYGAPRPELFFKSAAWRVAGPGGRVSARSDSAVDVPEPELAAVLNSAGDVLGYTICNDMSSRSIEGENPLYLPQAKIYLGGCAVGPWIRPYWEIADPYALTIGMTIRRAGVVAWSGQASTSGLRRTVGELAAFLFREDEFPDGVLLSTGTSLVPDLPFTLQPGDEVRISVTGIGELVNHVVRGKAGLFAARPP